MIEYRIRLPFDLSADLGVTAKVQNMAANQLAAQYVGEKLHGSCDEEQMDIVRQAVRECNPPLPAVEVAE